MADFVFATPTACHSEGGTTEESLVLKLIGVAMYYLVCQEEVLHGVYPEQVSMIEVSS
jgi:hypothetical protein